MRHTKLRRRAFFAALGALWLVGLAVTFLWFRLSSSARLPGEPVALTGLADSAFISIDSLGIPTIRADEELDAWRALGFMHATDRLWQLELFRRISSGRLSEVFGERALETDRFIRTLGLPRIARRQVEELSSGERAALSAYAEGVNTRIASDAQLPPEFQILRIEPGPWTPEVSLGVGLMMNLDLSHWHYDLSRQWAAGNLDPARAAYLRPPYPEWAPATLDGSMTPPGGSGGSADSLFAPATRATPEARRSPAPADSWDPIEVLSAASIRSASNAWVVGPSRTAAGYPILANDMHLALRAPSIWYIAVIHSEADDLHVAGFTLPGLPGVVVGYNRDIAWGATNGMVDDMDFVLERLHEDGLRYRNGARWLEFEVRPETIQVRGIEGPRVEEVRSTVRGPVISDALPYVAGTLSALWLPDRVPVGLDGLFALNRASSMEEFHAAASAFTQPHLNLVAASADGRIGYRLAGSIPVRTWDGALPVAAETAGAGWSGLWPADAHPHATEPTRDYIVTANNLQVHGLDGAIGGDWPAPFRALRITQALAVRRDWTVTSTARLQEDVRSLLADRTIKRAIDAARRVGADSVARQLAAWDRMVSVESEAAPIFYTWFYGLRARVAADEWRTAPRLAMFPTSSMLRVLEEGDGNPWVDDVGTAERETLADLEERAMRDAIDRVAGERWGAIHQELHTHPLAQDERLERLFSFDIGPYPSPGGPNTVRPDAYQLWQSLDPAGPTPPWSSAYGPSQRLIAEMTPEGPRGFVLLPTGESGNPFSPHYRDMNPAWREGRLVPLSLGDSPRVPRHAVVLAPERE
ncbi:MAG: penicillin acylase family protein [Gemmatimonadota bacterium]